MDELNEQERLVVAQQLAKEICKAIVETFAAAWQPTVVLINLKGKFLGHEGDLRPWQ